jgi:AcrR family transcriptional regulator
MKLTVRPRLDREFLLSHRRRRFAYALGEVCVEKGFRAATISDVVTRAETSRSTVYEVFSNKEEIFLALLAYSEIDLLRRIKAACGVAEAGADQLLEAGLTAVLRWVADEPVCAWALLIEAFCAGPRSLRFYLEAIDRLASLLRDVVPAEVPRTPTTEESVVGGVAAILSGVIRAGQAKRAPAFAPQLAVFLRGPYLAGDGPGAELRQCGTH